MSDSINSNVDKYVKSFKAEILAKTIAYNIAKGKNSLSDAAEELKKLGYNYLFTISNKDCISNGIHIYVAVNSQDDKEPFNIIVRGTGPDRSIIQDLDPEGPGHTIFMRNMDSIMKSINEIYESLLDPKLNKSQTPRPILVTGHSLGGSVSQLIATALLANKAGNKKFEALAKMQALHIEVFQPAGVNPQISQDATNAALAIKKVDPKFKIEMRAHIKAYDIISKISGVLLFANADPELADVSLNLLGYDSSSSHFSFADVSKSIGKLLQGSISNAFSKMPEILIKKIAHQHSSGFNFDDDNFPILTLNSIYNNDNPEGARIIKEYFEKCFITELKEDPSFGEALAAYQKAIFDYLQNSWDNEDDDEERFYVEKIFQKSTFNSFKNLMVGLKARVVSASALAYSFLDNVNDIKQNCESWYESLTNSESLLFQIGKSLESLTELYEASVSIMDDCKTATETLAESSDYRNIMHAHSEGLAINHQRFQAVASSSREQISTLNDHIEEQKELQASLKASINQLENLQAAVKTNNKKSVVAAMANLTEISPLEAKQPEVKPKIKASNKKKPLLIRDPAKSKSLSEKHNKSGSKAGKKASRKDT